MHLTLTYSLGRGAATLTITHIQRRTHKLRSIHSLCLQFDSVASLDILLPARYLSLPSFTNTVYGNCDIHSCSLEIRIRGLSVRILHVGTVQMFFFGLTILQSVLSSLTRRIGTGAINISNYLEESYR